MKPEYCLLCYGTVYLEGKGNIFLLVTPIMCLFKVTIAHRTGWTVRGSNPGWRRDFPHLSRPCRGANSASCTMSTRSFPGLKSGRGVTLTPHPFLVPLVMKNRSIPLLPLWAVRPVLSLSACTGVTFMFTFYSTLQYAVTMIRQANINSDSSKPSVTIKGRNISGLLLEYLFVSQQGIYSKEVRDVVEEVTSYMSILIIDINTKH